MQLPVNESDILYETRKVTSPCHIRLRLLNGEKIKKSEDSTSLEKKKKVS